MLWRNNYNNRTSRLEDVNRLKTGQIIKVRAYGGEELVRTVVKQDQDVVVICRPEEYEMARLEGREPIGVGFHMKDIVSEAPAEDSVRLKSDAS